MKVGNKRGLQTLPKLTTESNQRVPTTFCDPRRLLWQCNSFEALSLRPAIRHRRTASSSSATSAANS